MKKEIQELVEKALTSLSNKKTVLSLGTVSREQGKTICKLTGIDMTGKERLIDNYHIRHALAEHGSPAYEAKRGQLAITIDDFQLLPDIFKNPDQIKYGGKNKLGQDIIQYYKRIGNLYIVVEAVRVAKKGDVMEFNTLYKRK